MKTDGKTATIVLMMDEWEERLHEIGRDIKYAAARELDRIITTGEWRDANDIVETAANEVVASAVRNADDPAEADTR